MAKPLRRRAVPVDPAALRKLVDKALAEALDRLAHAGTKPKGRKASVFAWEEGTAQPHSQSGRARFTN